MSKNINNTFTSESWNLPISKEEWEEIMEYESIMEMEETMRLEFEDAKELSEEIRMMRRSIGHYADDRDYCRDYEDELDYRY